MLKTRWASPRPQSAPGLVGATPALPLALRHCDVCSLPRAHALPGRHVPDRRLCGRAPSLGHWKVQEYEAAGQATRTNGGGYLSASEWVALAPGYYVADRESDGPGRRRAPHSGWFRASKVERTSGVFLHECAIAQTWGVLSIRGDAKDAEGANRHAHSLYAEAEITSPCQTPRTSWVGRVTPTPLTGKERTSDRSRNPTRRDREEGFSEGIYQGCARTPAGRRSEATTSRPQPRPPTPDPFAGGDPEAP